GSELTKLLASGTGLTFLPEIPIYLKTEGVRSCGLARAARGWGAGTVPQDESFCFSALPIADRRRCWRRERDRRRPCRHRARRRLELRQRAQHALHLLDARRVRLHLGDDVVDLAREARGIRRRD